jgi:hypothetical protein
MWVNGASSKGPERACWQYPPWFLALLRDDAGVLDPDIQPEPGDALGVAIMYSSVTVVSKLLEMGANPRAECGGLSDALEYSAAHCGHPDAFGGECCKVRALIHHAYHMPSRLSATAWCLHEMGGAWPDMIEPLVQERLTKTTF